MSVCRPLAVEMREITKRFPGVLANDRVDFSSCCGELHAIVGENGAGKTTLMNILYGLYQPDSGDIRVFGNRVHIRNPRIAIKLGIGMVHQHFMLVPRFTVLENVILGEEPVSRLAIDYKTAEGRLSEVCERFSFRIDLHAYVEQLSVSAQQKVEILKALYRRARILILDEPTSVLAPSEAESLLEMLKRLAGEGMCVILVSHKLGEVMGYSDRVTVLRQGRTVGCVETSKISRAELAHMMIGEGEEQTVHAPSAHVGGVVFSVRDLHVTGDRGAKAVDGVTFDLRAGEIVGVAGVDGNGQRELAEALVGLRQARGCILLEGVDISNLSVGDRLRSGIAYIPEDRRFALIPEITVQENTVLGLHMRPPVSRLGLLNWRQARALTLRLMEEYGIRAAGPDAATYSLSGGNQQKIVLGRALFHRPRVLIACQPVRGLDISSAAQVHRRIVELRDQEAGILLFSFDLDEILSLSDRVMVMFKGRIAGVLMHHEANRQNVGALMLGASTRCAG